MNHQIHDMNHFRTYMDTPPTSLSIWRSRGLTVELSTVVVSCGHICLQYYTPVWGCPRWFFKDDLHLFGTIHDRETSSNYLSYVRQMLRICDNQRYSFWLFLFRFVSVFEEFSSQRSVFNFMYLFFNIISPVSPTGQVPGELFHEILGVIFIWTYPLQTYSCAIRDRHFYRLRTVRRPVQILMCVRRFAVKILMYPSFIDVTVSKNSILSVEYQRSTSMRVWMLFARLWNWISASSPWVQIPHISSTNLTYSTGASSVSRSCFSHVAMLVQA